MSFLSYDWSHSIFVDDCIQKEKALELERSLEDLNEQLSSVRTESNAKDDLLAKQAKVTEEAIAGLTFFSEVLHRTLNSHKMKDFYMFLFALQVHHALLVRMGKSRSSGTLFKATIG